MVNRSAIEMSGSFIGLVVLLCSFITADTRVIESRDSVRSFPSEQDVTRAAQVVTDMSNGEHRILVQGAHWLSSGFTYVRHEGMLCSTDNGLLKLTKTVPIEGVDGKIGKYKGTRLEWQVEVGSQPRVFGQIKEFSNGAILFDHIFPDGLQGSASSDIECQVNVTTNLRYLRNDNPLCDWKGLSAAFPTFQRVPGLAEEPLGWMQIYGPHINGKHGVGPSIGAWENLDDRISFGLQAGPMTIFNEKKSAAVISAHNNFMSASIHVDNATNQLEFGLMGGVNDVPIGYSITHVLFAGADGINRVNEDWGKHLLNYFGKGPSEMMTDMTRDYLSYTTDNGAYYYYHSEQGKSMYETLLSVYDYSNQLKIPYRNILLDSWWYYKGHQGGVSRWDAREDVFPNGNEGMNFFRKQTKWNVIAHNRYWENKTVYDGMNGGQFQFVHDESSPGSPNVAYSLPVGTSFWDFLFSKATLEWGLYTYEQDWLWPQFLGMTSLLTSPTLGREWLLQMGLGAEKHNVRIEYCMVLARHVMQSVEIPAVTQVRASDDYGPAFNTTWVGERRPWQWRLGRSSIFANALALAPSKDGIYTKSVQPGGAMQFYEPITELNCLVATMSTGPVMIADGIGYSDRDLIMRSCNEHGLILKPSKAMTAMDYTLIEEAFGRSKGHYPNRTEIWGTYSSIGTDIWFHVLAADLQEPHSLKVLDVLSMTKDVDLSLYLESGMIAYSISPLTFDIRSLRILNLSSKSLSQKTIDLEMKALPDFEVWHFARVLENGWCILGELEKWVPMSPQRVKGLSWDATQVSVLVKGSFGEQVTFIFGKVVNDNIALVERFCVIGRNLECSMTVSDI